MDNSHLRSCPKNHISNSNPVKTDYTRMSLINLYELLANHCDQQPLQEFLDRKISGNGLGFIDCVDSLKIRAFKTLSGHPYAIEIAETARDLTVDKFIMLPEVNNENSKKKRVRTNRRLYYGSLRKLVYASLAHKPPINKLEKEARIAMITQWFIRRQFYRSMSEALRKFNRFWSRYCWKVKGRRIYVYFPAFVSSQKRRRWLEENMDYLDPEAPNARKRIQEIINYEFGGYRFVSFNEELSGIDDGVSIDD